MATEDPIVVVELVSDAEPPVLENASKPRSHAYEWMIKDARVLLQATEKKSAAANPKGRIFG